MVVNGTILMLDGIEGRLYVGATEEGEVGVQSHDETIDFVISKSDAKELAAALLKAAEPTKVDA